MAGCSPELWRRLTERELNPYDSVAALVLQPELRGEAKAALAVLESRAAGCGAKAVVAELLPLVTVYGVADRSEREWAAYWRLYSDVLADLPLEALRAGVKEYVAKADSEFFPRPGPLRALCQASANPVQMALHRARVAVEAKTPEELGWSRPDHYRYLDYLRGVSVEIIRRERAA